MESEERATELSNASRDALHQACRARLRRRRRRAQKDLHKDGVDGTRLSEEKIPREVLVDEKRKRGSKGFVDLGELT